MSENTKTESATDTIKRAWQQGRPIVPFFGAGISVGAGFPLTGELREYFCKVLFYIRKGGYRVMLGQEFDDERATSVRDFENNPSKYLASFGWPDFFRINADLFHLRDQVRIRSRAKLECSSDIIQENWMKFIQLGRDGQGKHNEFINETTAIFTSVLDALEQPKPSTIKIKLMEKLVKQLWAIRKELEATPGSNAVAAEMALHAICERRLLEGKLAKEWSQFCGKTVDDNSKSGLWQLFERIGQCPTWKVRKSATTTVAGSLRDYENLKGTIAQLLRFMQYASAIHKPMSAWGSGPHLLDAIVQSEILEMMDLEDSDRVRILEPRVWNQELKIRIDWFRMLLELVEGRMGLADLLFSSLNRYREPSPGHTAIAHLACRMGWPLILTLNHDTLLERAFQIERLPHKVFDISKDANVPDRAVVLSEWLSIIKLHGSSYGLRLGEPTNLELDTQTRDEILKYIPPRSLIVVAGFSGYERRMMSLIEAFNTIDPGDSRDTPRVVWLHQESDERIPHPVKLLERKLQERNSGGHFKREQIQDAGSFFLGVYQSLTKKLPRTRATYECLPKRLFRLDSKRTIEDRNAERETDNPLQHKQFPVDLSMNTSSRVDFDNVIKRHVFFNAENWSPLKSQKESEKSIQKDPNFKNYLERIKELSKIGIPISPSLRMSEYVQSHLYDFRVIWIDIEDHHTISGIVTEIADRMRVHDPSIPPLLLPVTAAGRRSESHQFSRAVRYLKRALRRGRYALVFDSLEGFGRGHTSHHGLVRYSPSEAKTSESIESAFETIANKYRSRELSPAEEIKARPFLRIVDLVDFFRAVLSDCNSSSEGADDFHEREDIGNSIICASVAVPSMRHGLDFSDYTLADEAQKRLRELIGKFSGCELQTSNTLRTSDNDLRSEEHNGTTGRIENFGIPNLIAQALIETGSNSIEGTVPVSEAACRWGDSFKFLVLQILVVFRRPRSIASIQWTVKRFVELIRRERDRTAYEDVQLRERIEETLNSLANDGIVNSLEGGFYWIEHHTHEFAYRILTHPFWEYGLSTQTEEMKNGGKTSPFDLKQDLLQCLCISSWNSTIARFYYVHSFQRSGDVTSLFEYIYHRISSLRYLRLARILIFRARKAGIDTKLLPDANLDPALFKIVDILQFSLAGDDWQSKNTLPASVRVENDPNVVADNEPHSKRQLDLDDLLNQINKGRSRLFRTLINVVDREQHTILRAASADTWLNWIETLFQKLHDIYSSRSEDKGVWREYAKESADSEMAPESETALELATHAAHFRILLLDLKSKLLREKGDYDGCIRARLMFLLVLTQSESDANTEMKETHEDLFKIVRKFAELKRSESRKDGFQLENLLPEKKIVELVYGTYSDLAGCSRRARKQTADAKYKCCFPPTNEPVPSHLMVADEMSLADWAHRVLPELVTIRSKEERNILELRIRAERIRTQVDDWDPWMSTNRSECFAKALSDISKLESRVYGAAFRQESDFNSVLAETFSLRGWIQTLSGNLEEGMYSLGEALNGLREEESTQQFQISVIRRRFAHCLMQDAHQKLDTQGHIPSISDCDFAETRLREATQELAVAERILKRGRRNVRAWKHLYRAKAQLEVEWLLLLLQRIQSECLAEQESERFVGVVQERLLAGLEAIRGGFDCTFLENTSWSSGTEEKVQRKNDENTSLFQYQVESEVEVLIKKWIKLFVVGRFLLSHYINQTPSGTDSTSKNCGELGDGAPETKYLPAKQRLEWFRTMNRNFKVGYRDQWISLNNSVGIDRLAWHWSHDNVQTIDTKGRRWKVVIDQLAIDLADMIHDQGPTGKRNCNSIRSDAIKAMQSVLKQKCSEVNERRTTDTPAVTKSLNSTNEITLVKFLRKLLLSVKSRESEGD